MILAIKIEIKKVAILRVFDIGVELGLLYEN
jgi:hypothetical protein